MPDISHEAQPSDAFFEKQTAKLDYEHRKTTFRVMTNVPYDVFNLKTPTITIPKRLQFYRLGNYDGNYYHVAFILEELNSVLADFCIEIIKEDQSKQGGLLGAFQYWDENPKAIGPTPETLGSYNFERDSNQLIFTNRVYIYTDELFEGVIENAKNYFKDKGYILSLRDTKTWNSMESQRKSDFFLCHDSGDKEYARELYNALVQKNLKVFFDEVSIELGDSLLQKIEEGIKQSAFGLILVTPNFLKNQAWAKRLEFESFVTKYLITKTKTFVPVWHNVTPEQVADASPFLAGLLAAKSDKGVTELAQELHKFLRKNE